MKYLDYDVTSMKSIEREVIRFASDVYYYLEGKVNLIIPCKRIIFKKTNLLVETYEYNGIVMGICGIQSIGLNVSAIVNKIYFNGTKKKRVKSHIITSIAHELSHLDQDTNVFHYSDEPSNVLPFEVPNVIFASNFLDTHYDEMKKLFGAFDPLFEMKFSSYLDDRGRKFKNNDRVLVKNLRDRILDFIENATGIKMGKVLEKYKSLDVFYNDKKYRIAKLLDRFDLDIFRDPITSHKERILDKVADFLDSITAEEVFKTNIYQHDDYPTVLVIEIVLEKYCEPSGDGNDLPGLVSYISCDDKSILQDAYLE